MDRLTYKNYIEEYEVKFEKKSDKQWSITESDTHIKITGEPIDKLAEFEDFLEEQGFESLEDLKKCFEIWNSEDDEAFSKDNDNMKLRVYRFAKNQLHFHLRLTKLLSYRWQKLKEYVEQFKEYDPVEADLAWKIAEKMKELEGKKDAES